MKINVNRIASVYSGREGACCCGCAGKHYYARRWARWSSERRGYRVTGQEISDRMVKKVCNIVNSGRTQTTGDHIVSVVVGKRIYVAYLRD